MTSVVWIRWSAPTLWFIWNEYGVLVGKPGGKRSAAKPKPRWEDNIKMYVEETVCECERHSSESKYGKEGV